MVTAGDRLTTKRPGPRPACGHQSPSESLPPGQAALETRTSPGKPGATRSPTPLGTLMVPILCSVGPPHARASPFGAVSDFQARHSEITVASGGGRTAGRTAGRDCNYIAPAQTGAQRLIRAYWHPTLPVVLPVARCSHHFGLHTSTRSESPRLCCGRQPPRCGFSGLARPLIAQIQSSTVVTMLCTFHRY